MTQLEAHIQEEIASECNEASFDEAQRQLMQWMLPIIRRMCTVQAQPSAQAKKEAA